MEEDEILLGGGGVAVEDGVAGRDEQAVGPPLVVEGDRRGERAQVAAELDRGEGLATTAWLKPMKRR